MTPGEAYGPDGAVESRSGLGRFCYPSRLCGWSGGFWYWVGAPWS